MLGASSKHFATCAFRPSILFGPGDHLLVPQIHELIVKGETPYVIGDGDNLWDLAYVGNIADAHVLAVENLISSKTAAGQAFLLSNEEPIAFRDLCLAIWANFGHYPPFEVRIPFSIAYLAGYIAEWLTLITGTPFSLSRGSVLDACATRYWSGAKARRVLGYKPRVGLEEGLRISCNVRTFLSVVFADLLLFKFLI